MAGWHSAPMEKGFVVLSEVVRLTTLPPQQNWLGGCGGLVWW